MYLLIKCYVLLFVLFSIPKTCFLQFLFFYYYNFFKVAQILLIRMHLYYLECLKRKSGVRKINSELIPGCYMFFLLDNDHDDRYLNVLWAEITWLPEVYTTVYSLLGRETIQEVKMVSLHYSLMMQ